MTKPSMRNPCARPVCSKCKVECDPLKSQVKSAGRFVCNWATFWSTFLFCFRCLGAVFSRILVCGRFAETVQIFCWPLESWPGNMCNTRGTMMNRIWGGVPQPIRQMTDEEQAWSLQTSCYTCKHAQFSSFSLPLSSTLADRNLARQSSGSQ